VSKALISLIFITLFLINSCKQEPRCEDLVKYVDPLVGTMGGGDILPAVGTPFAMTNFIPATNENAIGKAPYIYNYKELIGFMGSHQPSGPMGDYGFVTLWPCMDKMTIDPRLRKFWFSHDKEISTPYYYSVDLLRADSSKMMKAEFTASERCGYFIFDMQKSDTAYIAVETSRNKGLNNAERHRVRFRPIFNRAIDSLREISIAKGYVEVNPAKGEITGYNPEWHSFYLGPHLKNFRGYFVIQFEKPFDIWGTWNDSVLTAGNTRQEAKWTGGYAGFTNHDKIIRVKVGTSFISLDQCRENLDKEMPGWDFDAVKNKTRESWQKSLEHIQITATDQQKRIFYTSMYHSLLLPRTFSEYGRYYSAFDDSIHDGISYNDYSLWDTFRAEHPLLLFIAPDRVSGMINSLIQMYEEGGWLPKWPNPGYTNIMIATHADAVIADAVVKGVKGFDLEKAYEAMRKDAFTPPAGDTGNVNFMPNFAKLDSIPVKLPKGAGNHWWGRSFWRGYEARGGLTWYLKLGYVPVDMTNESVSRTLEYAYDDFCVAQVASKLSKKDDAEILLKRSRYWENVYNRETGFMAPRWSTGEFRDGPFTLNGRTENGFTEGGPWTYLFCVMQDVKGLATLMGGNDVFISKLDSNFSGNYYQHGNEPGHHYTYLYDYVGQPWKTQEKVRQYTLSQYKDAPDGLRGNDDCGQMSAWYIFSAMGFYPVCPGTDEYAIGSPLFPEVKILLNNNKILIIKANNVSEKNCYIHSLTINGKVVNTPFLKHSQLEAGGTLVFEMDSVPDHKWGIE